MAGQVRQMNPKSRGHSLLLPPLPDVTRSSLLCTSRQVASHLMFAWGGTEEERRQKRVHRSKGCLGHVWVHRKTEDLESFWMEHERLRSKASSVQSVSPGVLSVGAVAFLEVVRASRSHGLLSRSSSIGGSLCSLVSVERGSRSGFTSNEGSDRFATAEQGNGAMPTP